MKDRWQWIDERHSEWMSGRKHMVESNQDLLTVACLLEGETDEVSHAVLDYLIKPEEATKRELEQELADVFLFLYQTAHTAGIDLFEAVRDKMAYNITRYTSHNMNNGWGYEEGRSKSREWVKERNWKEIYYAQ